MSDHDLPLPVPWPDPDLDGAMFSLWRRSDWRQATSHMHSAEREAAADAVQRHYAALRGDPRGIPDEHLRWWRQ